MDTILSKIVLESMVLSGRVKQAEQGRSGNPFKRNKRNCSIDESSPNVVLGNTPSKESTLERRCDGYMDLVGCSFWDSPATLSAQLRGSLRGCSVITRMGSSKTSGSLSGTSTKFLQLHFPSLQPSPVENKSMEYSVLDCFSLLGLNSFFFVFKANGRAPGGEGAMPARRDDKTP